MDAASACSETIPRCVHALSKLLRFQEFGKDIFVDDEPLKRIEVKALAMLREQLSSAVHWVIGGLKSELGSILINRPGLSMALANQIVSRAQQVGSTPVVYALQALRTESIGVLHLIATGQPEHDARRVQEAIFSGQSLPDTFAELGVAKSTHRLTVLRPAHSGAVALVPAVSLNDLSITGRDWLNAMRLTKHLPLQRGKDHSDFGRLLNQLLVINFQRSETAPRLLQWSIRFGYARSNVRLERLVLHSQKLVRACNSLTGKNITIDDAITALLDWLQNMTKDGKARDNFHHAPDSDNHNAVLAGVALVLRQPIGKLTQSIFDAHPMLPKNFITPKGLILHALDSLDLATSHGKALNNCLRFPSTVVNYVMQGLALYGVHTKAGVIGTIALKYDKTEKDPQVEVQEVAGINNAPAELALCELAQRLAASWTTAEQEANWTEYEDQCTQWRHLLSSVAQ